jgi:cyclopropane fatty-acyl-phospholipid synthase-like methyltransferase
MTHNSAERRVVEDYFRTTSSFGSAASQDTFDASVIGLKRRLRPWLDLGDKDVLDLGSGTGELCRLAEDEGAATVVGVNLSQGEVEYARSQSTAKFVQQDILSYLQQRPSVSVDRIFALNILEHLDKSTLLEVMENVFRILRDGGQFVAMVPNATSPFGAMTRYWDITHQNAFTPSSFRQLARLVGFGESVEFRECGPVAHGLVSGIRYVLWQMIRLGIRGYLLIELASGKGGIYTADMQVRLRKEFPSETER